MNSMAADAWATRGGAVKWPELSEGLLRLRPATADDAESWHAIRSHAGPWQSPLQSVAAARELLLAMAAEPPFTPGWRQFLLLEGADIVGDIGLNWPAYGDYAEIGFELAPAARGRGLAQRAVRLLGSWLLDSAGLLGVVAITHTDNKAARAVLLEAGLLPCADSGLAARFDLQPHERLHLMARPADA
jgi:RimJ/RimL family protein N-acetyltransferase